MLSYLNDATFNSFHVTQKLQVTVVVAYVVFPVPRALSDNKGFSPDPYTHTLVYLLHIFFFSGTVLARTVVTMKALPMSMLAICAAVRNLATQGALPQPLVVTSGSKIAISSETTGANTAADTE